jgi:hypothetical protein
MCKLSDKLNLVISFFIKLIKKKIEDYLRRWHEVFSEALWVHRISRHGATKITPNKIMYGQEVVLLVEVNLAALRFSKQNYLSAVDFHNLMMENIEKVPNKCFISLRDIYKEKLRVARACNKKCEVKEFPSWWPNVESNPTSRFEGQKIWQMVSELGGSFQVCESGSHKIISSGVFGGKFITSSTQRNISNVLSECVARSLNTHGRYNMTDTEFIIPRTNG